MEGEIDMTLLTKQEVSKRLGCSIRTVDRLMQTGDLPYFRPSPHIVRFDERDVEAHLAKCRVHVHPKAEPTYRRFTYVPGQKVV